ncbi:LOW QUALITY PROTEIN: Sod_Fe_N domain-containing protein/Sod_Fe_C domain-containing protein, partial [Cephalotus follicularis]
MLGGQARGLQTVSLPDLPYECDALEPAISGEIMQIHHQKHHQTYVANTRLLPLLLQAISEADVSTNVQLQSTIKFNGGGHINHSISWKNLTPIIDGGGEPPREVLGSAIDSQFGSLEALIEKMNAEGAALQGSGWVITAKAFAINKVTNKTLLLQDPLITKGASLVPLLGIDVWEHAYYLQYKNARAEYLNNIWKVVNWKYASEVY